MFRVRTLSAAILLLAAVSPFCNAQSSVRERKVTELSESKAVKAAFESRIGDLWVGGGTIPGMGAYESEVQFVRLGDNQIAVVHKMTVSNAIISSDSLWITFGPESVSLEGVDMRGRIVRARMVKSTEPAMFIFQANEGWRSVYSDFQPDSFLFRAFTMNEGVWTPYLEILHKRVRQSRSGRR